MSGIRYIGTSRPADAVLTSVAEVFETWIDIAAPHIEERVISPMLAPDRPIC